MRVVTKGRLSKSLAVEFRSAGPTASSDDACTI
jgi:hypothetical protein